MRESASLIGFVFGRLTVASFVGKDKHSKALWSCICECGGEVVVVGSNLKSGATQSCGCLHKEVCTTHGLSGTPQYKAYVNAKDRTTNPEHPAWLNYGGRGIEMCDEWENSLEAFHRDMSASWRPGLTLEREDVDGNYCPENCTWATESVQAHTKRKKPGCSSQYKGVSFAKTKGKFVAQIRGGGKKKEHIGCFLDELDAARAYDNRSEELYGDRPNKTIRLER